MATRRNRIVVKPNLKPAVAKAGPVQKTKPSQAQAAVESIGAPGKSAILSGHQDKNIPAVNDVEKAKGETSAENQGNEMNVSDGNVIQKPVASHLKPTDTDANKQFGKASSVKDKDDGGLDGANSLEKSTVHLPVESALPENQKQIIVKQKKGDTTTLKKGKQIQPSLNHDSQKLTKDVELIEPSSPSACGDTILASATAAGKGDRSKQLEADENDGDQVDARVPSKTVDVLGEVREVIEDETPQPKLKKRKKEKKERKEPLPPSDHSPDRHKMRMSDLIVWNPSQNYFPKKKKTSAPVKKEDRPVTPESPTISIDDESSSQSSSLPAPQVMIGPDGNIILNTQSLIIENPKDDLGAKVIIEEDDDDKYLNSNSYRKTAKPKMWTENENEKFFMGLSMCGTDFSLMCKLLPKRSRRELKNKFRREEKRNRILIDKALSSRQPYDVSPFERMAAEETAKLKEAIEVKKELKRKHKAEVKEQKPKKIKKEKERSRKKKIPESEDEEDDWDEPEYDDDKGDESPEEEDVDEEMVESAPVTRVKKKKNDKDKKTQPIRPTVQQRGDLLHPNLPIFAVEEDVNQPFVPRVISAADSSTYNGVTIVTDPRLPELPISESSRTSTVLLPPDPPTSSRNLQGSVVRRSIAESSNPHSQLTSELRSIPGSAPIQIEMEGVTTPLQGVLIPSHMVPRLAPQLGIPPSTTPIQVLLVQEMGAAGNMVHVYVVPEKDSSPFAQTGHGRVATNESGQGLTLTSPLPSPHTTPRRPSISSTPTPASAPFSPSHPGPQNATSSTHQSDGETSMSTIRNVYGTAMNSLSTTNTAGKEMSHPSLTTSHPAAGRGHTGHPTAGRGHPDNGPFTVINHPPTTQHTPLLHHTSTGSNPYQHTSTSMEASSYHSVTLPFPPVQPISAPSTSNILSVIGTHSNTFHPPHTSISQQQNSTTLPPQTATTTTIISSHENMTLNILSQNAATHQLNNSSVSPVPQSDMSDFNGSPQNDTSDFNGTSGNDSHVTVTLVETERKVDDDSEGGDCLIVNSNNPQSCVEHIR